MRTPAFRPYEFIILSRYFALINSLQFLSRTGSTASPLSTATQSDILGILQREQDRAISLLSLSPLLSSLFISYANRAAALESAAATPSPSSEEWTALQTTVATLREENEKLKSENFEVTGKLEVAVASQEAFQSQVSSLRELNVTHQDDIKSLRSELSEAEEKYDQFVGSSNAERAAFQIQLFDLEVGTHIWSRIGRTYRRGSYGQRQRAELKETVVEQQIKISTFRCQSLNSLSNLPATATPTEAAAARGFHDPKGLNTADVAARITKAKKQMKWKATEKELAEREAMELVEREAREQAEKSAREQAEREEREWAEKEARERTERGARERAEREHEERREEREWAERSRGRAEMEARERAEREEEERREEQEWAERSRRRAEMEARERAEREEEERREEKEWAERNF